MRIDKILMLIPSIIIGLSSTFTIAHAETADAPSCLAGAPECPMTITIPEGGGPVTLHGRLSPERSSYSYQFAAEPGRLLRWTYQGPAVHVLLTDPDGNTDGPGLPSSIHLDKRGAYVFSVSSNKMAENIYGDFSLTLEVSVHN
jgi:hypothetical protein